MEELSNFLPTSDNRPKRKCPYCAEEILAEAVICRFCGREVNPTNESAKRIAIKKVMQKQLDELEKWNNANYRFIQEQMDIVKNSDSKMTWGWIVFILGIFLAPILIGIVICIIALFEVNKFSKLKNDANALIFKARNNHEIVKNKIIDIKSSMSRLDE